MNIFKRTRVDPAMIEECSSRLPEPYNLHSLRDVMVEVEKIRLLDRWLFWSEIAVIGYQGGAIPEKKVPLFRGALAFPFAMLEKGESLILGEFAVEPRQGKPDEVWYRITLHEPNLKFLRPVPSHLPEEACV